MARHFPWLQRKAERDRDTKRKWQKARELFQFSRWRPIWGSSIRIAMLEFSPGESQVKLVQEPGIQPPTNKPHNGTLSGSKWEHSFSLPQVYLSPHALMPQCRGALSRSEEGRRKRTKTNSERGGGEMGGQQRGTGSFLKQAFLGFSSVEAVFDSTCDIHLNHRKESIILFFGSGRWYLCWGD